MKAPLWARKDLSQSLSGWDGVFHQTILKLHQGGVVLPSRNPFQGGMGFFTRRCGARERGFAKSRNPFQGGMGFFTTSRCGTLGSSSGPVAIPFRVGWGFSH